MVLVPDGLPGAVLELHLRRKVHAEDVSLEPDAHPVLAVTAKRVDRRAVDLLGLGLAHGQDLSELLGGYVLLGNDELQRATTFRKGAFCRRLYTGPSTPMKRTTAYEIPNEDETRR